MASTDVAKGLQYKVFINPDNAWDRTANVEEARSSMVKEPTIKDDEPWRYSGTPEVSLRLQVPTSVDPEVQHHYNQGAMMIREFLEEHSADLIKDIGQHRAARVDDAKAAGSEAVHVVSADISLKIGYGFYLQGIGTSSDNVETVPEAKAIELEASVRSNAANRVSPY